MLQCQSHHLPSDDLNPLERQRIRESIRRYGGDMSLLPLADEELDGALGLVITIDGFRRPTLSGLLLMGREEILRQHAPAHEVAFQVLEGTDVKANEFFRKPLLQTFEEVECSSGPVSRSRRFRQDFSGSRSRIMTGALSGKDSSIPLSIATIRGWELFIFALTRTAYLISSPGGFVEGITLQNLLVTAPRSRNPLLADIVKRIGLAERTGRGIDRIYEGMLRYGRPAPDYTMSDSTSVVLIMPKSDADIAFLENDLAPGGANWVGHAH